MADLSYDVQVNTSQAERNLANLQKSVGGINTTFLRFRETIATISLGAVISQALQYADAISDLSDASGIAIGNILGFSAAVQANGGSAEGAQKAILKLVNAIGDAADGSEETQKQFKAVGVSLNDLRTLSEQEILQKTIEGLDKITDNGKRSIAVTALLGKEFRNVAAGGLAKAYADSTIQAQRYSSATKSAADASDNIARAVNVFRLEFLKQIKPVTDFINNINIARESVSKFFDVLGSAIKFAAIAVGLAVIGKVLFVIGSAAATAYGAITTITGGFIGLIRALSNPLTRSSLLENLSLLSGGLGNKIITVLNAMGISTAFLARHWLSLTAGIAGAVGALKEYLGLGSKDPTTNTADSEAADKAAAERAKELREVRDKAAEREMDRIRKFNAALTGQQQTYTQLNNEAQTFSNYLLADLKFQTSLLGMTEDQKEIATALNAETQRYLQQQNSLQSKLSDVQSQIGIELKAQKTLKDDDLAASKDKVSLLVEEEGRLQQLSKTYYDLHISNGKNLETELKKQQQIKNAEAERLSNLEYISERLKEQAASYESLGGVLRSINDKRVDLKFESNLTGLSPLRKQIATINEEARKAALEAGRAFGSTFESEDGLTPERAEQLAAGLGEIADAYKAISTEQIKALGVSEQYLSGNLDSLSAWREEFKIGTKNAFDKFKEDANDAGKQAADSFSTFTSGMEDAFVQFVQTGKLSFKSLANSIIADLVRIAVRRAIVAAIGGPLGSLFGMANGGPVQGATPIIVGERGPELFVPQSAGKIISNSALKGSGQNGGGSSAPQQTVVNYNIEAVDAASFRQLVARDPSFIYAVTEQGRRSQPTRSR
jgi:lambda family phage tail tape measure protein